MNLDGSHRNDDGAVAEELARQQPLQALLGESRRVTVVRVDSRQDVVVVALLGGGGDVPDDAADPLVLIDGTAPQDQAQGNPDQREKEHHGALGGHDRQGN